MTPADVFHKRYAAAQAAETAMHDAVKIAFPVGERVHYVWRGLRTSGEVLSHGYFGRVFVLSPKGARYWIEPHHIAEVRL